MRRPLAAGPHRLIVKARGPRMAVCVDGWCVSRSDTALGRKPAIAFQDGEGVTFDPALQEQAVPPVRFIDDFAREELPGQSWMSWPDRSRAR